MNDEPQNIEQANFEVQRKTLTFETAARPPGGWVSPPAVSQGPPGWTSADARVPKSFPPIPAQDHDHHGSASAEASSCLRDLNSPP